jgi:BlaI family transcriptional regulator, penicillinase repressor
MTLVHSSLSRRERQVMEVVYRTSSASVGEIRAAMPQPTSYSAARVIVNVLERKGHLKHSKRGRKYFYSPTVPRKRAVRDALKHLLRTYFDDSLPKAVAAMVQMSSADLTDDDVRQLIRIIEDTKTEDSQ